jgi:hypothetical protein
MDKDARPVIAGWEYKVIKIGPSTAPESEAVLNELGSVGWDLVDFQQAGERAYPGEGTYILKRPRTSTKGTP